MAWATNDAEDYLSSDGTFVEVQKPKFTARNDAMYVNLKDDKVYSPSDAIGRKDAQSIIHTVEVAFQRIFEVTEFWGHQIGTKGFMK
jgi:AbiV family abortive infection protein